MPASSSSSSSGAPGVPTLTFWVGNAQTIAQVVTITVTAVPGAGGGVLTVQISDKVISYVTVNTDTTATAAAALQALLAASTVPEFAEVSFATAVGNVITCTAVTAGLPFTLTASGSAGASMNAAVTTANGSPNSAGNPNNWIRNLPTGQVYGIPINGDDVQVSDSNVSILYDLSSLANVQFNSYTRYDTFTGQIGLPENNPSGYYEYRPTYFQFSTVAGPVNAIIGLGPGGGASLERYNAGGQQVNWNIIGAGSVRILNTNPASVYTVNGATLDIGTLPGESAVVSGGITVINGGTLNLGQAVTFAGTLKVTGSSVAFCACIPTAIICDGASVEIDASTLTGQSVATVIGHNGSQITWASNVNIGALTLDFSSNLDKSVDARPITIQSTTIDPSTCQINDPLNAVKLLTNAVFTGPVTGVWFVGGPGRSGVVV